MNLNFQQKTLRKTTDLFFILLVTVFLFAFGQKGYETLSLAKQTAFFLICGGYCFVMLLMFLGFSIVHTSPISFVKEFIKASSWAQRIALIYLLLTLISTLASPFREYAWFGATRKEGFVTIAIYCAVFILIAQFSNIKKWMVYLLGASCVVLSVICIFQLNSINVFSLYPEGYSYWDGDVTYGGKFIGTIGNIDLFAAFLCIAIPVLWSSVLLLRDSKRFFLLIPLLLMLYLMIRINVAAGIVGVVGGSVLCLPVILKKNRRTRWMLFLVVLLIMAAAVLFVYLKDFGGGTYHELHQLLHGRFDESFASGRFHIWSEVLKKGSERPWFGYGPDTMILAEITPFQRYDDLAGKTIVSLIDAAHNEYLNVFFHQGLFAALSYAALIVVSLIGWIKNAPASTAAAICGCGVLCWSIQSFFGISQCITSPFFWVLLGFLDRNCNPCDVYDRMRETMNIKKRKKSKGRR